MGVANVLVSWDNEAQTAIRFDLMAGCDWIEFWEAMHEAYRLMESVEHQVDLIINPAPGATPPMRALMNFKRAQESAPANQGRVIIVGVGMYGELLFNTFTRIYSRLAETLTLTSTLEKARAALAERAPSPAPKDIPPTWR